MIAQLDDAVLFRGKCEKCRLDCPLAGSIAIRPSQKPKAPFSHIYRSFPVPVFIAIDCNRKLHFKTHSTNHSFQKMYSIRAIHSINPVSRISHISIAPFSSQSSIVQLRPSIHSKHASLINPITSITRIRPFSSSSKASTAAATSPEHVRVGGGGNDPANGSQHWKLERLFSAGTLGCMLAGYAMPGNSTVDLLLAVVLPIHCHIGLNGVILDYLPVRRTPVLNRLARAIVGAATIGTMYGFYCFNTENIGITQGIRALWTAR